MSTTAAAQTTPSSGVVNRAERVFLSGAGIILLVLTVHRQLLSTASDHILHLSWLSESSAALGLLAAVMNFHAWKRIVVAMGLFTTGAADDTSRGLRELFIGLPLKI